MSTHSHPDGTPLDRPGATLVCDTSMGDADEACTRALAPAGDESILWVSYTHPPEDCLARLPAVPADRKSVIDVGGGTRSAATNGGGGTAGDSRVSVADPNDLTGIGIAVAEHLADNDGVRVCFDSVTAMLQYVGTDRAYTFLNSLLGHLWNADARAHFHFNPNAHDDATVAAITSLFDARVDVNEESLTVRARD
ncbi:hypothetical protein [Halosegnis sp.]|uniref:DUF7504 family protein n=1 Tax=Halosegnis sp. TaxID=2864959 RepID=UPI0035D4EBEC